MNSMPAQLDFLETNESGSYWERIQKKFNIQKKLTPENPYSFKMVEFAKTVEFMKNTIRERLSEYGNGRNIIWRPRDVLLEKIYKALNFRQQRLNLYKNIRAERDLLNLILHDLDHIDVFSPQYDQVVKMSYFVSRALSMTVEKKQFWMHMFLDIAQETKIYDPVDELTDYKNKKPAFSTQPNFLSKHFVYGHFAEIFDTNQIQLAVVPVVGTLSIKSFLKFRNQPVHLMSVIYGNLAADGWNMNEHQLGVHDYYFHGAQKYYVDLKFKNDYRLTDEQSRILIQKQDEWFNLLWSQMLMEPDIKMRSAILEMISYVLHDRPRAFFPDSFIQWNKVMVLAKIRHKIVGQLYLDGISDGLVENILYNSKAVKWLNSFWSASAIQNDPFVVQIQSQKNDHAE